MNKYFSWVFILISINCYSQNERQVGANLTDLSPFGTLWTYTNALKQSSGWLITNADDQQDPIKQSTHLRVELSDAFDSNGYPLQVPFEYDHPETLDKSLQVSCLVLNGQPAPYFYPAGDYLLVYEGSGTILIQGDVDGGAQVYQSSGQHTVPISNPTNLGLELFITSSLESDPVRNVQLIFPDYINNYQTVKFQQDFIDLVSNFNVLRFMKPMRVEHNVVEDWDDRPSRDDFSHYMDIEDGILLGMPYEDIIEFCNINQIDPWICVPHRANDDYVTQLARLFEMDLGEERTLYLEYTNEGWNPSYPEKRQYMLDQGTALGLATSTHPEVAELEAVHRFHALRSFQIFEIFESIYSDQERVFTIHGTQSDPYIADLVFDSYDLPSVNPNNSLPDAVAVAAYVGVTMFDDFETQDLDVCAHSAMDLIDSLLARAHNELIDLNSRWSELSNQHGVELFAYEGGQHVTEINFQAMEPCAEQLVAEMNRLPEMEDFFCLVFDTWFDTLDGELFMVFNLAERPDAFGAFGILESQWQPTSQSPKWQGLENCGGFNNPNVGISSENSQFLIYPNPTRNKVHLRADNMAYQSVQVQIYNMLGNLIYNKKHDLNTDELTVDVFDLNMGTYYMNLLIGSNTEQKKLIIE